jgi:hypothetical protein
VPASPDGVIISPSTLTAFRTAGATSPDATFPPASFEAAITASAPLLPPADASANALQVLAPPACAAGEAHTDNASEQSSCPTEVPIPYFLAPPLIYDATAAAADALPASRPEGCLTHVFSAARRTAGLEAELLAHKARFPDSHKGSLACLRDGAQAAVDCGSGGEGSVVSVRLPGGHEVAIKTELEATKYAAFARQCGLWAELHRACPAYVLPLLAAEWAPGERCPARGAALFAMPACGPDASLTCRFVGEERGFFGYGCPTLGERVAYLRPLLASLLLALDAAHAAGIVWGDAKTCNVLHGPGGGRPQIIDFGVSLRLQPGGGLDGKPAKSPGYTAPECAGQQRPRGAAAPGAALDAWGVGCIAAAALLRDDFDGAVAADGVLDEGLAEAAVPEGVPPELRALLFERLLVREPDWRATPAQAMGHAFFEGIDWDAVRSGAVWR